MLAKIVVLASTLREAPCFLAANNELAVVRLFDPPLLPHNHRRDRIGSLNMRNIETLNSRRIFRKAERVLQASDIAVEDGFMMRNR